MGNDKQLWEKYGEDDPYYAVASFDKFKSENLDDRNLDDFFDTGRAYVEEVWSEIEKHFEPDFKPAKAIDFGCVVGRLTIPLSEKCGQITGVDISSTMVKEARKNAESNNFENVEFIQDAEGLANSNEIYDFVHSFIVIQHIEPKAGMKIFERLVKKVKPGGIGALHVTYHNPNSMKSRIAVEVYKKVPLVYKIRNNIKNDENAKTLLPMHEYDLNRIFQILQDNDCHECFTRFTFHGLHGILILFKKSENLFTK